MNEPEIEWVSLIQGGTDAIRSAVKLLEEMGIDPRVISIPGG
ncbi:MAG: hypothetical protein AAEJ04_09135 [Planctomycetota bacterium]